MTGAPDSPRDPGSVERQALAAIRHLREKLDAIERARNEPIAVVGIGCRVPGAGSPAAFWDLLLGEREAIRPIPAERWGGESRLGGAPLPEAGVLDRVDEFDAEFFGISPREARFTDPQQRLFLEVVWEALEDANIPPPLLKGSRTGVFVGSTTTDYLNLVLRRTPLDSLDAYLVSGNSLNAVAGRVAFTLGLQGPAIAMDTACSSSLVAVDRACRSLRDGESTMAIAGGVNLIVGPEIVASLAKWGMLSPANRCKTFDATADGFVRGEGCGVVVLKRKSDAERDGDRILALILGSAVNQDGASAGFSVPNGLAQEAVIGSALRAAGIEAAQVGYVEAHGTGTPLGDPIEIEALTSVYGRGRPTSRPLLVGSVKTNVGHLEAAAGITGLLKVILSLRHRTIPAHLNHRVPNPHIPWARIPVEVADRQRPWEQIDGRRVAGLSSFGFSGTNAHLVIAEAPDVGVAPTSTATAHLVTLSGRSPAGLAAVAREYAVALETGAVGAGDIGPAVSAGRAALPIRAAVVGGDRDELAAALRAIGSGEHGSAAPSGAGSRREMIGFLYTGQGSQYPGMAASLGANSAVFREAFAEAVGHLDPLLGESLSAVMDSADGRLDLTQYTQPSLFALQYGLSAMWKSLGVVPSVVAGHSIGEYAAACCAGILDLQTAARLVVARGKLMGALPPGGAMAAVSADVDRVEQAIRTVGGAIGVAAINASDETVISGDAGAVDRVSAALAHEGVRTRRLSVSHAFHSPLMGPMVADFRAVAGSIDRGESRVRLISSVTGALADDAFATAGYWADQIIAPVRFAEAAKAMTAAGVTTAVELGPHPVLAALAGRGAAREWVLPSIRKGHDGWRTTLTTLGRLFTLGAVTDWSGADGARRRRFISLPTYPFQRTRHWIADGSRRALVDTSTGDEHPLLGARLPLSIDDQIFHRVAAISDIGQLAEHRIRGRVIVPAAAILDAIAAVGWRGGSRRPLSIGAIEFRRPLQVGEKPTEIQTVARARIDGGTDVVVNSRESDSSAWATCAVGSVLPASPSSVPMSVAPIDDAVAVDPAEWYRDLARAGVDFGSAFRSLLEARRGDGTAWGRVSCPHSWPAQWAISPSLLDGCLQVGNLAVAGDDRLLLPVAVEKFHFFSVPGASVIARATRTGAVGTTTSVNVAIATPDGVPVAFLENLRFAPASADSARGDEWELETIWRPMTVPPPAPAADSWSITGEERDAAAGKVIVDELAKRGVTAGWVPVAALTTATNRHVVLLQSGGDATLRDGLAAAQRILAAAPRRVVLVTRQAQAVHDDDRPEPSLAALWGLWRSALLESPEVVGQRVDLDTEAADVGLLAGLLMAEPSDESELAIRGGQLYCARLVRSERAAGPSRVVVGEPGNLDSVSLAALDRRTVGPRDVAIVTRAAGLNFRDVLSALGMFGGGNVVLGGECSGVVTEVGTDVTDLAVGDEVIAIAPGGLATHVVVPRSAVARRPAGISPVRAAGLPVAYLTAILGLEELARVKPGERVLVHAGAGGVGQAAIRIAQLAGCEVYATAGSEWKRKLVEGLGVRAVFDSRTPAFRDEIRALTNGEGVDVVLNSLSGSLIDAGFGVLREGGRFLELGKRGIWTAEQARRLHPGIAYLPFDLGDMASGDATLLGRLFRRLEAGLESGAIEPVPVTAYRLSRPADAFRAMAQGRHVGKLVFVQDLVSTGPAVRDDATYLISGGTGGIGLAVAEELVNRGAKSLVLVSRHGLGEGSKGVLEGWSERGADVRVVSAELGAGTRPVAEIRKALEGLPPLRGVIHGAGIRADGSLAEQTAIGVGAAWATKVGGAEDLAAVVGRGSLDFFVAFGAGAATLGAPGQAGYAAANAGLEAWSNRRFVDGEVASVIAWGRWGKVGMAARMKEVDRDRLTRSGIREIDPAAGVGRLLNLIERSVRDRAVLAVDWTTYLRETGTFGDRRYAELAGEITAPGTESPLDRIRTLPTVERRPAVVQAVAEVARRVLGVAANHAVDPRSPLRDLGLDSLMAVELRNALTRLFGVSLPTTVVFDHPTIEALADLVGADVLAVDAPPPDRSEEDTLTDIGGLSEADAEAALLRELESGGAGR